MVCCFLVTDSGTGCHEPSQGFGTLCTVCCNFYVERYGSDWYSVFGPYIRYTLHAQGARQKGHVVVLVCHQ